MCTHVGVESQSGVATQVLARHLDRLAQPTRPGSLLAHDPGAIMSELRRLEFEPSRFLRLGRPVQAVMLLAATRSVAELEARQNDSDRPALVALAETAIRLALAGSPKHAALVPERLEGRPGLRSDAKPDEQDGASAERAALIHLIIESLVAWTWAFGS